jgi:hypothetical protein
MQMQRPTFCTTCHDGQNPTAQCDQCSADFVCIFLIYPILEIGSCQFVVYQGMGRNLDQILECRLLHQHCILHFEMDSILTRMNMVLALTRTLKI